MCMSQNGTACKNRPAVSATQIRLALTAQLRCENQPQPISYPPKRHSPGGHGDRLRHLRQEADSAHPGRQKNETKIETRGAAAAILTFPEQGKCQCGAREKEEAALPWSYLSLGPLIDTRDGVRPEPPRPAGDKWRRPRGGMKSRTPAALSAVGG
ncbi:hypothetical protein SKAU_G00338080 [Synaphobranchus kaupii]|uniref:Uncharacterized protein n=1 Tax=Synaphobranchus kaupii TaxID=118154 RepID=A0A9Q1EMH7_SYNKA|nr:hypothetical protein SKAU_G00338080 [Synaphobranchus kaupii]